MIQKDYGICIEERRFINYIKKYYLGIRVNFVKNEIKRNEELGNLQEELVDSIDSKIFCEDWLEQIENKEVFQLLNNLPIVQREVVNKVVFEKSPLSEVAQNLGISKQLAYAYKKNFVNKAQKLLSYK